MIVGLSGRLGSGKDEVFKVASMLASGYGLPTPERMAFADPLKQSVAALWGITPADVDRFKNEGMTITAIHSGSKPEAGMSFREFLQRYGTESHRGVFGESFWVDATLPENFDHDGRLIFVTDMRFENEFMRIRSLGGMTVRVIGPKPTMPDIHSHSSETSLDDWMHDHQLSNIVRDDDHRNLHNEVGRLLVRIQGFGLGEVGEPRMIDVHDG